MICKAKHTKYQPTIDEYICPKCGAKDGDFALDDPAHGSDADCELLHPADYMLCNECGYGITGSAFAAHVIKINNRVPCKHCKGTGFVKKVAMKSLTVSDKLVWTRGHDPFVTGGAVDYVLKTTVPVKGPYTLENGYKGYLVTAPNGKTFVAEALTGAFVGPTLESVRADIKQAKPYVMKQQIKEALQFYNDEWRQRAEAKPEAFWSKLGCLK